MMMLFGSKQMQKPELQRQSSDESYSSTTTSPSKTHRRTPSFVGWTPIDSDGSDSDVSVKSSNTKATDPLNVSWSSSGSYALSQVDMMDCSPERKSGHENLANQEDKSVHVLELIRQLSFSPPRKTKKRTDIDDSDSSSPKKHDTSPIGLDLKYLQELRKGTPSPLLGLQYLPDGNIFI
jgi:hypothetical protein